MILLPSCALDKAACEMNNRTAIERLEPHLDVVNILCMDERYSSIAMQW